VHYGDTNKMCDPIFSEDTSQRSAQTSRPILSFSFTFTIERVFPILLSANAVLSTERPVPPHETPPLCLNSKQLSPNTTIVQSEVVFFKSPIQLCSFGTSVANLGFGVHLDDKNTFRLLFRWNPVLPKALRQSITARSNISLNFSSCNLVIRSVSLKVS
jgi:hypothetical protein